MPHRLPRYLVGWVGRHANVVITGLLLLSVALALFAGDGYRRAMDAQNRVNSLEVQQQQEEVGKRIADVATCFNRARARPQLTRVLRAIAGGLANEIDRAAAQAVVMDYEKSTPGRADCVALARKLGVDPTPYLEDPEPDGVGSVPER